MCEILPDVMSTAMGRGLVAQHDAATKWVDDPG
jgi:hypothetical protein